MLWLADSRGNVELGYKLCNLFPNICILEPSRAQATLFVQFSNVIAYRWVLCSRERLRVLGGLA